jgi:two-component system, OmpR family, KDP operon response regulator KdpE
MSRTQRIWIIINDEAPVARVPRRGLAASGYEAPVAGECEDELENINTWPADLVVTEVSTPNVGGLKLCR